MSAAFIAILLLFGIVLIILEILIIPGFIVGIAGGIFILMGLLWTSQIFGLQTAIIIGIITLCILGLSIWSALKTGFWKIFSLQTTLDGKMNVLNAANIKLGDKGEAVSGLRPMGTVRINGEKYPAASEGRIIPPNYPVIVIRIEVDRLIVEPII